MVEKQVFEILCCCAQQGKWKGKRVRDRASVRWRRAGIFQWVTGESTATQVENYSAAVTEMGHTLLTGSGVPGHPRVCGCKERESEKMMHAVLFSVFFPSIFHRPVRHSVLPPPTLTLTRRSQIPVSHLTTATWVSVQRYHFKQGTEVSLRPAALVYIMQMGTGEGQTVTVFYFFFFAETENYSVALSRTLEASPYCYLKSY